MRSIRHVSGLTALLLLITLTALPRTVAAQDPPFSGTIFIDADIITASDRTTFETLTYTGQAERTMYDRRVNNWVTVQAYLFDATFEDGLSAEIQVNPEFGSSAAAQTEAEKYAPVIGRLPTALRVDVQTVWIHKGTEPFGGGNNNLLIHTGQADLYENDGILEEVFVHEACHTSLDADHASAQGWLDAQTADDAFISTYARDNPTREDVAESFLPYLAIRHRADRISQNLEDTITQTIPNRIAYFDNQSLDMYPVAGELPVELAGFDATVSDQDVILTWQTLTETNNAGFDVQRRYREMEGAWTTWTSLSRVDGAGTTTVPKDYRFTDRTIPDQAASLEYRLRQVDLDGTVALSEPVAIARRVGSTLQLSSTFPNPAGTQFTVQYTLPRNLSRAAGRLELYDMIGRRVRQVDLSATAGRHEQPMNVHGLASGVYILRLTAGDQVRTERVTVVK